ncbi:hypothetical protein ACYSNR_01100 [Enterococcus sp. LJL128]
MERIKKLTSELLNACIDENVAAIVILEERAENANGVYRVGSKIAHITQLLSLCDTLSENCDCSHCRDRRASEQEHEGEVAAANEVFAMLREIMKGDSNG